MVKKRNLRIMLMTACIVTAALAAGLLALNFMPGREAEATNSEEALDVAAEDVDASGDRADALFEKKVEDTNDTASVVDLLETMGMDDIAGEYEMTITAEGDSQTMNLKVAGPVQNADRKVFDSNMQIMAEQLMALTSPVTKVQWTYPVLTADAKEETVTVSLDEAGADDELGKKVKKLGSSADKLRTLLEIQAEKE